MTPQATPPGNRALAESAQRTARLQESSVPVARVSYRIAGGLVAVLVALMLGTKVVAALRSDSPLSMLAAEDFGMLLLIATLGLTFGFVAFTGSVPKWLWKRMVRTSGSHGD